jgi:DNA invertase Pin-like site-specific DNA recombinase
MEVCAVKIATYTRVSDERLNSDNQKGKLDDFARSQGWEIVSDYADVLTGSVGDRPGWQKMLAAASRREFDLLLVFALDRISRQGAGWVFGQLSILSAYGVKFHSFMEPMLSTFGPFGDVALAFYATFAKLERDRLIERTLAGLDRARRAGKVLGRPKRVVDAGKIFQLRQEGKSWRQIAKKLNVPLATCHIRWKQYCSKKATAAEPTSIGQTNHNSPEV